MQVQLATRFIPPWFPEDNGGAFPPSDFESYVRVNIHGLFMGRSTADDRRVATSSVPEHFLKDDAGTVCDRTRPTLACHWMTSTTPHSALLQRGSDSAEGYFDFPFIAGTFSSTLDGLERYARMAVAKQKMGGYHYHMAMARNPDASNSEPSMFVWGCASLADVWKLVEGPSYEVPLYTGSLDKTTAPLTPRLVSTAVAGSKTFNPVTTSLEMPFVYRGTGLAHPWHKSLDFQDLLRTVTVGLLAFDEFVTTSSASFASSLRPAAFLRPEILAKIYIRGECGCG